MPQKITNEIITAAIAGFEQRKVHLDAQIAELRALLFGGSAEPTAATESTRRKRRKMSAAGRARIAEAQRKRWAALKGETERATPEAAPKRELSAAGRKAIIAANKKRWARQRAKVAKAVAKTAAKEPAARKVRAKKGISKPRVKTAAKRTAKAPAQTGVAEAGAQ